MSSDRPGCYRPAILDTHALDASLAWLGAAALVSGALAYVGAMVGLVLGQFRLPLLVVALGSTTAAAASNLAISSLGAASGAIGHAREGRIDLRLLLSIGGPSGIAAFLSSRWVTKLEVWWIGIVIGVALLLSAIPIARKAHAANTQSSSPSTASTARVEPAPSEANTERPLDARLLAIEILIGAILGGLSGVVGLLLGTLRLPAMLRLGVGAPRAAGTNMAIGFFTGVGGALGALGSGSVSWLALGLVGAATFVGAWLGAHKTKRLPTRGHLALIAGVLVVVGLWMIGKSIVARPG